MASEAMATFLAYVWRLIVILAGFAAACIVAAAVFFASLSLTVDPTGFDGETVADVIYGVLLVVMLFAIFSGMLVALPAIVFAVLSEALGWRGFLFHGVVGAALGAGATVFGAPNDGSTVIMAGAAAGIVGGWAYWLIAGRNAGKLFDRITAERSAVKASVATPNS
jgi:hypothetical protein